ncbi:hypothetical protein GWI33_020436, partial [Rhynchophorus ferrugineus]
QQLWKAMNSIVEKLLRKVGYIQPFEREQLKDYEIDNDEQNF